MAHARTERDRLIDLAGDDEPAWVRRPRGPLLWESVAHEAFMGLTFGPKVDGKWKVSFGDHDQHIAYLRRMDEIKRQQLAKAGARLAEILNTIWPKN